MPILCVRTKSEDEVEETPAYNHIVHDKTKRNNSYENIGFRFKQVLPHTVSYNNANGITFFVMWKK